MSMSTNELEKWLTRAINRNDPNDVQSALNAGANVDQNNGYGIFHAIESDDYDLAKVLVENGADLNKYRGDDDEFPLTMAIENEHLEIAKLFIANGATDLNSQYDTVLRKATEISPELLAWCFEHGAKANDPVYLVNHCAEQGRADCLAYLADRGLSMTGKDLEDEYPLYVAAIAGRADNIEIILNKGAEPNDQKALLGAINNGHLEATKLLVERGTDLTANGSYALHQAITWGHDEITTYLIAESKMPVSEGTRAWLKEANPDNTSTTFARQLLDKRDLNERLQQKYQRPTTTTKTKSQSLKI